MRSRLTFLVLWAWLYLGQVSAWAIVIDTGNQRVVGYLEHEDDKQITVRIKMPGGKDKVETFDRAKIKVIHKVDQERLEKLTKTDPKAYRDYAEELAKKNTDPEATELALRLFLIAAHLDPPNLGRSCLLSMSALAAHPADARKYRAMAFLLDSKSDQSLLKADGIKVAPQTPIAPRSKAQEIALKHFQAALRKYRNGQIKEAKDSAKEDGVAVFFSAAPGLTDQKSFLQACTDVLCTKCKGGNLNCPACNGQGKVAGPFGAGFQPCGTCNGKRTQKCSTCDGSGLNRYPEDYLRAVLRAEVWSLDQLLPNEPVIKKNASDGGWSRALNNQQTPPVPSLRLETITEYDPRECVFRNGKWVAP